MNIEQTYNTLFIHLFIKSRKIHDQSVPLFLYLILVAAVVFTCIMFQCNHATNASVIFIHFVHFFFAFPFLVCVHIRLANERSRREEMIT